MTNTAAIEIDAGTLDFSEAEDLYATGLLVPYGVECRSSIGRFTVEPGALTIPADVSAAVINTDHDRTNPVAVFASIHEQPGAGYMARMRFANTPEGRAAYADAKSGKRKNLSVEARGVIVRAGKAIAGHIFGGALVERGAFDGATLLAAEDTTVTTPDGLELPAHTETTDEHTDQQSDGSQTSNTTTTTVDRQVQDDGTVKVTTTTVQVQIETPPATDATTDPNTTTSTANPEGTTAVTNPIPQTLTASRTPQPQPQGKSLRELNVLLAAAHQGDGAAIATLRQEGEQGSDLYAALSDIKATGAGGIASAFVQPQWVGEAYNRGTFERRYVPLFAHADLTSFTIQGYRWTTPPVMGEWTGNKTNVPSAAVAAAPYTEDAKGFAGAHDVDRRLRDFAVPEFWDGYWRHMSNSYRRLTDADAIATVVAGATPVVAGATPAGVSQAAVSIVDGWLAVQDEGVPTFAILSTDLWRDFILTPKDKTLEYLSVALGLDGGDFAGFRVIPARNADLAASTALVGIGQAATVYELPGSPLRVEGLDMVRGGIDPGAFGYEITDVEDAAAFAVVTPAGAAG